MNVLYTISAIDGENTGKGGHYYDLNTLANEMVNYFSIAIVIFGTLPVDVIEGMDGIKVFRVNTDRKNIVKINRLFWRICKEFKPDIIHSFTRNDYLFAFTYSFLFSKPVFFTKCGGGNPKKFYPYVKRLVVVSEENYNFFAAQRKYNKSEIFLLPNRVGKILKDEPNVNALNSLISRKKDEIILLKIGRIASHYEEVLFQCKRMIDFINSLGLNCRLVLIGYLEKEEIVNQLRKELGRQLLVFTDQNFTRNASRFIPVGDLIVGTGRGFMEACSFSKIVLCPHQNEELPLLADERNITEMLNYNFSPRTRLEVWDAKENKANLKRVCEELLRRGNSSFVDLKEEFYKSVFEEKFSIKKVSKDYVDMYQEAISNNVNNFNDISGLLNLNAYTVYQSLKKRIKNF